jgi:peptide/nickel transport system substrate-binding protein
MAHPTTAAIKHGGTLVVGPSPQGSWTQVFNPSAGSARYGAHGLIYEPLVYFNGQTGAPTPWLATKWKWTNGFHTLTFTIRKGVKWNDGKPFSASDVLYSAKLAQKYLAMDNAGMDAYLKSVTQKGNTVSFHFNQVNTTLLFFVGFHMWVLPKHIWASQKNPVTWTDPKPVGTGPFMLGSFSPQVYVLKANPHYWQHGLPYLSALKFPSYSSNQSEETDVIAGNIQWGGLFIADAAHTFVPKTKGNKFWYNPANIPAALYLNDAKQPFSNVHLRRAISYVINRDQIYRVGEYGYEPPSNAGFVQPQFAKVWGDSKVLKMLNPKGNLKAAKAELKLALKNPATAAALKKTYQINVVSGWSDWDTSVALMVNQLKAIGVKAQENQINFNSYVAAFHQGQFDMGMSWTTAGIPSPYPIYQAQFWGKNYFPVGKDANTNWERYKNPALDKLIESYALSNKQSAQVKVMKAMERIVARDVPIVPLVTQALWYEYNDRSFTGFPSQKHPYDLGPPWEDWYSENVALHLHRR